MKARLALMFVLLGSCAIPVLAHHSFAATYFEDKVITIEGDLVQFQFRNPHSFVDVAVKDAKGETTRWAVEWGGGGQLSREGVNRETLKPGDHVIISGQSGPQRGGPPDPHAEHQTPQRRLGMEGRHSVVGAV